MAGADGAVSAVFHRTVRVSTITRVSAMLLLLSPLNTFRAEHRCRASCGVEIGILYVMLDPSKITEL